MNFEGESYRPRTAEEAKWEVRTTEHGPFYEGGGKATYYTQTYYDSEGRYRGAVPDPEHGAPYGWEIVNGTPRPVDPFH